jgi:hypothetical protein
MVVWDPDLTLRLTDHGDIEATRPLKGPAHFVAPDFSVDILPITTNLHAAIRDLLNVGFLSNRAAAQSNVENHADELYEELINVFNGAQSLAQIVSEVIADAREAGRIPSIVIRGAWYAAPWELIRLPGLVAGQASPRYLGEVAIVAAVLTNEVFEADEEFVSTDPLQLVSWSGEKLTYLKGEMNYVRGLSSPNLRPPRVVNNLPGTGKAAQAAQTVGLLMYDTCQPHGAKVLHCACHSERPGAGEKFKLLLAKSAEITAPLLRQNKFGVGESNIGFFNTCHAFSTKSWHGGGIAHHATRHLKSRVVVASGCLIDDFGATDFAKAFLDRLLPLHGALGMPLGRALFEARNALIQRSRPTLIGLCYRLLGTPQLRIRVGANAIT